MICNKFELLTSREQCNKLLAIHLGAVGYIARICSKFNILSGGERNLKIARFDKLHGLSPCEFVVRGVSVGM